jgi:ribosomal protein L7Ae-like RNA K-turn-binding protein
MNNSNFYSFLGLCQRAGKVVSGELAVNIDLKKGKIKLLVIAEDTSDNTKNEYLKKAIKNKIPVILIGNKDILGAAIGKSYRALIGVKDMKMAINLIKIYENK